MQRLNVTQIRKIYHGELHQMQDGDQLRVDHVGCPSGEDSRGRLYIKKNYNSYVAYCHNCGGSGVWSAGKQSWLKKLNEKDVTPQKTVALPTLEYDMEAWPVAAQLWLNQYDIASDTIGWSAYHQRLALPFSILGEFAGYQTRRVLRDDDGPKYLTYRIKTLPGANLVKAEGAPLVIVEDILSSIKLHQAGFSALALLSSNMNNDLLPLVNKVKPPKVYIWLDDDNETVKEHQRKLAKRVALTHATEIIKTNGKDPKAHTLLEIKDILK